MRITTFRKPGLACLVIVSLQWTFVVPPALAGRDSADSRRQTSADRVKTAGVVATVQEPGAAGSSASGGTAKPGGGRAKKTAERVAPRPPAQPHVSLPAAVAEYNRHLDETEELLKLAAARKGRTGLLEAKEAEFRTVSGLLEEKFGNIRSVLFAEGRSIQLAKFDDFLTDFRGRNRGLQEDLLAVAHAATPASRVAAEERLGDRLDTRKVADGPRILGRTAGRSRGPRWGRVHFETKPPSRESTVVPAYLGGQIEKTTQDLDPTPDVQITPEIVALAAELDHSPVRIYEWVRNHTTFEPYFGSRKGSQAALETRSGNDYDLASLTLALLRASGIPSRYVRGTVEIPTDRILNWLGLRHPGAVNSLLNSAGIDATPVVDPDDTIVRFDVDRVWVEALVPYSDYRGVAGSTGAGVWVPLDPAFKLHVYQQGIPGIGDLVPFDEDGYLAGRTELLAYEWYQNQVREWLSANLPQRSLADVPYKGTIEAESLGLLPASLPHEAVAFTGEWTEVPEILRHRWQLTLFDQFDNPILDLPGLRTAATSLSRITISYQDTAASRELVAALGGPAETPALLQTLTPEIKIDGAVAGSGSPVSLGDPITVRLRYSFPDDDPIEEYFHESRNAGDYHALAMDLGQLGETLMDRKAQIIIDANAAVGTPGEDLDALEGELLSLAGMRYWQRVRQGDDAIADLFQYKSLTQISEVLVTANTDVQFLFDRPFAATPGAVNVDAQTKGTVPIGIDDDEAQAVALAMLQGRNGSAQEHAIWEEIVHVDSVSTIKALQFANETDINGNGTPGVGDVLDLDTPGQTSLLCPGFSPLAASSMEVALAAGKQVKTPYCDFVMNDWNGVGWIEQDLTTGEGAYLIAGFLAGGETTLPLSLYQEHWLSLSRRGFQELVDCAGASGVEVLVLAEPRDVARLSVPPETRRRIRAELLQGRTVQAPASAVDCDGNPRFGYFVEGGKGHGFRSVRLYGGSGTQSILQQLIRFFLPGPPKKGGCPNQQSTGSPVTLVNGNMYHQFLDLEIAGVGPRLRFERTYNSQTDRLGPMGYGWSHSYDVFLSEDPGVSATVTDGAGGATTYIDTGGGTFETPAGLFEQLEATASGWTLRFNVGDVWSFDTAGRLVSIADAFGNTVTLAYDGSGRLISVTDALSRSLVLVHGADGLLDSVSDWTGRTWTYAHDAQGDLVSSITPSDALTPSYITNYSYYDLPYLEHNLAEIQFPEGYAISFDYYANDKAFRHTESGQRTSTYVYQPMRRQTLVIGPRGGVTRYSYDEAGQMTHIEDPDGSARSLAYDDGLNLVERIDRAGYRWTYTYDDRGRPLTITNPLLETQTYSYATTFPLESNVTDPLGNTTTYDVDPVTGRMTRMVDPAGGETLYTYDARGRLATQTDPRATVRQHTYDAASGRIARVDEPLGVTTSYAYDALSRVTSMTDAEGSTFEFAYDALDRIVQNTDSGTATMEYNGLNRLTRLDHRDGSVTHFAHDQLGEPSAVTDELGRVSRFSFVGPDCGCRAEGQLRQFTAPGGRVWRYELDERGRVIAEKDPVGRTTRRFWDARGLPVEHVPPDGSRVLMAHDEVGRLIQIAPEGGGVVSFEFDADGRLISASNATTSQSWQYDALGRTIRFEDSLTGKVVIYAYDPAGNRTQLIDGEGLTTTYVYDALGGLTSIDAPGGDIYTFARDKLSRTAQLDYPNGQVLTRALDVWGDALSLATTDGATAVLDRAYTYDSRDRALTEQDAIHGESTYVYDAAGRLLRANRTGRPDEFYRYDDADNRLGDASALPLVYDAADRLVRRGGVDYRHDERGNRVAKHEADRITSYAYDFNNRMVSADLPDGTHVEFRYDPFGRRIEKNVDGQITRLLRDGDEVLARYDGAGNLIAKYVRNPQNGRALGVNTAGQKYFLHHDRRGSTVAVTDAAGSIAARFVYDAWGNIVEREGSWNDPVLYIGRDLDSELGLYDLQARHYDPLVGRFLQLDPLRLGGGFANFYAYVGNDPINRLDPSGRVIWWVIGGGAALVIGLLAQEGAGKSWLFVIDLKKDVHDRRMVEFLKQHGKLIKAEEKNLERNKFHRGYCERFEEILGLYP